MLDTNADRLLLSGNEAVALSALHHHVALGTGYPGTPSTEILENFSRFGGKAQWAPNEKVALEVATGSAFAGARTLCTMKHVGVNVAADPLFTLAYTGTDGALVIVTADDPGMASSQNEQDNRYYARAAGVPMLEPASSQEAYDMLARAIELSEQFKTAVFLRMTTRICHSKTVVHPVKTPPAKPAEPHFEKDVHRRVMIPGFARPAHKKLRARLEKIAEWNETSDLNTVIEGDKKLGIITNGIAYEHVREAAPEACVFKLGLSYPLPIEALRKFVDSVDRCIVIDEGENILASDLQAAGMDVEGKPAMYRFGELSVNRVRRILDGDTSEEAAPPKGKPPQLCLGCPHRKVFEALRDRECIVSGDIGCYTLGVLPPFNAMDTCVCMGASIGVGLGLRHALPAEQASKVVSVIGDSTFMHSGITGLVEAAYNPPPNGHVVIVLDNGTTAMTGMQEHPGTGRALDHQPAHQVLIEDLARAIGFQQITVVDPVVDNQKWVDALEAGLNGRELCLIVVRRQCILSAKKQAALAEQGQTCKEGGQA
jgi:indolepyruvate ferredoxin oxidoreductase alpha subunit